MTTPLERTRAMYAAGEVLNEILSLEPDAQISEAARLAIQHVLRHYPGKDAMEVLVRDVTLNCPRPMLISSESIDKLPTPVRERMRQLEQTNCPLLGDFDQFEKDAAHSSKRNCHQDLDVLKHKLSCEVLAHFSVTEIRRKSLENIERWRSKGTFDQAYSDWVDILLDPDDLRLISAMVATDERSNQLRQSLPYVGLLDQELVKEFNEEMGLR